MTTTRRRPNGAADRSLKVSKLEDKNIKGMQSNKTKVKLVGKKTLLSSTKRYINSREGSRRSSLRRSSDPHLLYDFQDDSPKVSTVAKHEMKDKSSKASRSKGDLKNKARDSIKKASKKREQERFSKHAAKKGKSDITNREKNKQNNVKTKFKPLPQPNFDDVSPIPANLSKRKSNRLAHQKTPFGLSSKSDLDSSLNTPTVSIIEPEKTFSDDSAIFMSPRQRQPRFNSEKEITSTPAIVITKKTNKVTKAKQSKKARIGTKDTSTPCETKPKKVYTHLKAVEPKCSPVQRTDTPTSDYASMDSFVVPSPTPEKINKRKRGSSPTLAFSLEDDNEPEPLSLNRSINLNYSSKKQKKTIKSSTYNVDKVDAWASKVNSEFDDVENFELSIED